MGETLTFSRLTAGLVALMLPLGAAQAATITGVTVIEPTEISEDKPTNTEIQGYNEIVGYTLLDNLGVDENIIGGDDADGWLSKGTLVDSHVLFLNTASGGADQTVTVTFSERILGVMTDTNGSLMFASDAILGGPVSYVSLPGDDYSGNRGLEGADYIRKINDFSFELRMVVTEPGDWIRVVTVSEVPLPAGVWLLMAGVGALGVAKRRRKAA
jgi:hypothetical protein